MDNKIISYKSTSKTIPTINSSRTFSVSKTIPINKNTSFSKSILLGKIISSENNSRALSMNNKIVMTKSTSKTISSENTLEAFDRTIKTTPIKKITTIKKTTTRTIKKNSQILEQLSLPSLNDNAVANSLFKKSLSDRCTLDKVNPNKK